MAKIEAVKTNDAYKYFMVHTYFEELERTRQYPCDTFEEAEELALRWAELEEIIVSLHVVVVRAV